MIRDLFLAITVENKSTLARENIHEMADKCQKTWQLT